MRRDKEMAKNILAWMEANTPSIGSRRDQIRAGISFADPKSGQYDYTLKLLVTAGFLRCEASGTGKDYYELTWAGHDLLERLQAESSTGYFG